MTKKRILIIMGRYLPGYRTGGPVRTTKNLIDALGEEYDFRVLCQDRDLGDKEQYPGIKVHEWNQVGNASVYYIPEKGFTSEIIIKLSQQVDMVYLWGCFTSFTLRALWLKRIGKICVPVVVAAMGLFSPKAFRIKYLKKKSVTMLMNALGLFKDVYWSATSQMEANDIKNHVSVKDTQIYIAEDLPRKVKDTRIFKDKEKNYLNVTWISRVAKKKNLILAIRILQKVNANINFSLYGPIYDNNYWGLCLKELKKLPDNIKWEYRGNVESEYVVDTLKKHHIFLFPTLGENYGHVIQEALSAGCPCIISDQTPWQDLEQNNAGFVYSLDDTNAFVNAVEKYADMNSDEFNKCINDTLQYAIKNSNYKVKNTGYRKIFDIF